MYFVVTILIFPWSILSNNAFIFEFGIVAKIHQQSEPVTGSPKLVVNLGTMLIGQLRNSFYFQHNLIVADKIGNVFLFQRASFIGQA